MHNECMQTDAGPALDNSMGYEESANRESGATLSAMPAKITRLHPWRRSTRKAIDDFTEVCRQTGLDAHLRMDEPTGADIERLARLIGQTDDWPPER